MKKIDDVLLEATVANFATVQNKDGREVA